MRLAIVLVATAALGGTASAQKKMGEVDVDRGPTSELYIRKRPPIPEAPVLSDELKKLLNATETKRDQKRLDAIAMLRGFLASDPLGDTKADGTFKLAELLWEEARRQFLINMAGYERELESCSRKKNGCDPPPKEPRIDLAESEGLYRDLLKQKPDFRRADLVTYLIGFAAKEDLREEEALARFREVIEKYPDSPLYGDAWMMVGEHHFQLGKWPEALAAYSNIGPDAPTYDVALFKTAWCQWKLGDTNAAAISFKKVLDLNEEAKKGGSVAQQRRRASLRDEALDYLVIVFTEDRSISAQEVFDFLASIGGEKYSKDVLIKVAESYVGQSEFELANNTFKFLIKMDNNALKSAEYQRSIIENWNSALEPKRAQEEIGILLKEFGPGTAWAKAQRNKEALNRSIDYTEKLVRVTARNLHSDAQSREKGNKCKVVPPWMEANNKEAKAFLADHLKGGLKRCGGDVLPLYKETAAAYGQYLDAFAPAGIPDAAEVRFLRAQILFFKIGELESAGDEFMAVARTAPVGKYHKDALRTAMDSYELARPKDTAGRQQLYPVDEKFGEAMDLYATLFPGDDKELTGRIYKNGKMFYDYGKYDQAIKRFGIIVTQYPKDPNAGPAGDHILDALNKAEDYENIEDWARKLKGADAFKSKDQQERLDRLIVESIAKSGDKYAGAGKYEKAAGFYLRVPKEFPNHATAPEKMMNAGVMYEKAKLPERAADVYLELAQQYKKKPGAKADQAAFAAGIVYDKVVFYDRAADAFEMVVKEKEFRNSDKRADALYNAGRLRQALGQSDKAIALYKQYADEFPKRPDASAVAFNVGVVYEESGEDGKAEQAFKAYYRDYPSGKRVIEAHMRAGRAALKLGQIKRASDELDTVMRLYKKEGGKDKLEQRAYAAEARYYQGDLVFRQFESVRIDVKPKELTKALKKKLDLLAKAQGVYESVIEYEDPKWATAALYRTGQIFDSFAEALINTPTPAGLSEADAQAYRDAMDLVVVETQEKAVLLFSGAYEKAIKIQVYDNYTAKIREALGRLAADKFPPEREARAKERFGDRPLGSDMVSEVVR
jgi:cellulose synthase operon protein C